MLTKLKIGCIGLVLILNVGNSFAQTTEIDTLLFSGVTVIPHNLVVDNLPVEELSGIEYSGVGNQYFVIPQSRSKSHIFLCSIDIEKGKALVKFDSVVYLNHTNLEAESIRLQPLTNSIYIAEECKGVSYIHKVNKLKQLDKIYTSTMPQRYNSGFEGLCFNMEGTCIYMALERPKKGYYTQIIRYNLEDKTEVVYSYLLDKLPLDKKNNNGITELLSLNDSTLLVVERAYLGANNGNTVRVYKASIPKVGNEILKVKLLTDFSASPEIDNIEGVSFSASGKELIFVSDNNANKHQQTLFIVMRIE